MKEYKLKRDLQLIVSSSTHRLLMMFAKFIVSPKSQSNKYSLTFEIQIYLITNINVILDYNSLVCNRIMQILFSINCVPTFIIQGLKRI